MKKWRSQNFDLLRLKVRLQVSFWGAPAQADIIEFSDFLLQFKNQKARSKTARGFSISFILKEIMTL